MKAVLCSFLARRKLSQLNAARSPAKNQSSLDVRRCPAFRGQVPVWATFLFSRGEAVGWSPRSEKAQARRPAASLTAGAVSPSRLKVPGW